MKQSKEEGTLRSTIRDFETVLEAERRALHVLDRDAIEAAAGRKLELSAQLAVFLGQAQGAAEALLLSQLLEKIRRNHLLLSHAKSCISGILSMFQGRETVGYCDPSRPSAAAVRLSVRG